MADNNRYKKKPKENLAKEQTYKAKNGLVFMVEPVFKTDGHNTLTTALIRMMQFDVELSR